MTGDPHSLSPGASPSAHPHIPVCPRSPSPGTRQADAQGREKRLTLLQKHNASPAYVSQPLCTIWPPSPKGQTCVQRTASQDIPRQSHAGPWGHQERRASPRLLPTSPPRVTGMGPAETSSTHTRHATGTRLGPTPALRRQTLTLCPSGWCFWWGPVQSARLPLQ